MARMSAVIVSVIMLVLTGALPAAGNRPVFEGGAEEGVAMLAAPDFEDTVRFRLPVDQYVLEAGMRFWGLPSIGDPDEYPEAVSVLFNDTLIWAFDAEDYGQLGRQHRFLEERPEVCLELPEGGGSGTVWLRLPSIASVDSTALDIECTSPGGWRHFPKVNGTASDDRIGRSVSDAGDVNGDGIDDLVAGAWNNDQGGANAGQVYIFLGNRSLDLVADVTLTGATGDRLGVSVSGTGDVNGDGYDDVIAGAHQNDAGGTNAGRAYIYFGGKAMDSTADVTLTGAAAGGQFGFLVSDAGDVNGDGYDDVIVGARHNDAGGTNCGAAFVFFGGQNMDSTPDVSMYGTAAGDNFGETVSGAGDVDGDGFDDVLVGASYNNGTGSAYLFKGGRNMDNQSDLVVSVGLDGDRFGNYVTDVGDMDGDGFADFAVSALLNDAGGDDAGRVYVFLGGPGMDGTPDAVYTGEAAGDRFGNTISGARDVNDDGLDDLVVGAQYNDEKGTDYGKVYVFFGNGSLDTVADAAFTGDATDDGFGNVDGAGDLNDDGYDDIVVGAPRNDGHSNNAGAVYLFLPRTPVLDSRMELDGDAIWERSGYFNGTDAVPDFAGAIGAYLAGSPTNGSDTFGTSFTDVPLTVSAGSTGNITLRNLSVVYSYSGSVSGLAPALRDYMAAHSTEKGLDGNLSVPVTLRSTSAGRVGMRFLDFRSDLPPELVSPLPDLEIDEDSANLSLLDLHPHFKDDFDTGFALNLTVVPILGPAFVNVSVYGGKYLAADASTGAENDNWTGAVQCRVDCRDQRGQLARSNQFSITVRNVNDPPEITSSPPEEGVPGAVYTYIPSAHDADGDAVSFALASGPDGMGFDAASGRLEWVPRERGAFPVVLSASDGEYTVEQAFSVTVPNIAPRILSAPPPTATTGRLYCYNLTAEDDNSDTLIFSLQEFPTGMRIDPYTGVLNWTPGSPGSFKVSVLVDDGKATAVQNFTIKVAQANRPPRFTSAPVTSAYLTKVYAYTIKATDEDGDVLHYSLVQGPPGMTLLEAGRRLDWTPGASGTFPVVLKVSDGRGGEGSQEFNVTVPDAILPKVAVLSPAPGKTLRGEVEFSGSVTAGTWGVEVVEVSLDGGPWDIAEGINPWMYIIETKPLKPGPHTLEARAYDGRSYSEVASTSFIIDEPPTTVSETPYALVAAVAVAVLAALGAAAFAVLRRRGAGEPGKSPDEGAGTHPGEVAPEAAAAGTGAPAAETPAQPPTPVPVPGVVEDTPEQRARSAINVAEELVAGHLERHPDDAAALSDALDDLYLARELLEDDPDEAARLAAGAEAAVLELESNGGGKGGGTGGGEATGCSGCGEPLEPGWPKCPVCGEER